MDNINTYKLQDILFPDATFGAPDDMYARIKQGNAYLSREEKILSFSNGVKLSFDTFYNAFSITPWKYTAGLEDIFIELEGVGHIIVQICKHTINNRHHVLHEETLDLSSTNKIELPQEKWKKIFSGLLFISIYTLSDGKLTGGSWQTSTIPVNDIRLALIITHFNRQEYVLAALSRLKRDLILDKEKNIDIFIIDNSSNLDKYEIEGVTVIPNLNLGGSGGFTRGLMESVDRHYTHCLFMDDDASCETESIFRAYQLLAYSNREKIAIAGSLLRAREPFRLFEKGAQFDGVCKPLKSGFDMRLVNDLLKSEIRDKKINYGGWWFFAFKISEVSYWPFPFFVRGDDIMFSITNKFDIVTMNGISCWGEDFSLKTGPLPIYLDTRNHLVQMLSYSDYGYFRAISVLLRFFLNSIFSFNYSTARSVTKAISHVLQGENFWKENIDMKDIRTKISNYLPSEKLSVIDINKIDPVHAPLTDRFIRKTIRYITLNGVLLPNFLLKNKTVYQRKSFKATFRQTFRYKRILYIDEMSGLGYIASLDRHTFLKECIKFSKELIKFSFQYRTLKKEYPASVEKISSKKFWDDVYTK